MSSLVSDLAAKDVGIGVYPPAAPLHVIKITEQLRVGYDGINYSSFTVDSSGNLTITPTGGTINVPKLKSNVPIVAVTSTAAPTSLDSGTLYTNEGDANGATVTLPTAVAGLRFSFCVNVAQVLTVTAATGDTIRIATDVTAAAGSISNGTIGSSVTLQAINATEWIATSYIGTWIGA